MDKDMKLRKFIATTIREYLNENKYVDDILDRKNKFGKKKLINNFQIIIYEI